jgi:hypothetical protein
MVAKLFSKVASGAVALAAVLGICGSAQAQAVVRQPGNHPHYNVEIEPHLAFQWTDRQGADNGFGPGVRFNIPFVHNGPIKSINNNIGISFGLDITFGGGGYGCYPNDRRVAGYDCSVTEFWLPVAMQWNFFLTKVISVFGEPGFAIAHRRWSYPWYCNGNNQALCDDHFNRTTFEPVFWGGGRFMFSDKVGATIRLGFPMITAGINILL